MVIAAECKALAIRSNVRSHRVHFVVSTTALKSSTVFEVGGYRLEVNVQDAWVSC